MKLIFTVLLTILPKFTRASTCDWPLEHRMCLFFSKMRTELTPIFIHIFMMVYFLTMKIYIKIGLNYRYIEKS